jgi:hypothetical protein
MPDLADHVCAYVRRVTREKRPGRGWNKRSWSIGVVDIADALELDCNAVLTALRKGEDRCKLRLLGDPVHSVMLDETHPDHIDS